MLPSYIERLEVCAHSFHRLLIFTIIVASFAASCRVSAGAALRLNSSLTKSVRGPAKPKVARLSPTSFLQAIAFIENRGQFPSRVRYQVRIQGQTVWLTGESLLFDVFRPKPGSSADRELPFRQKPPAYERFAFEEQFVGASKPSSIESVGQRGASYSFFTGDQKNWRTGIASSGGVVYRDIWSGVDLKLYSKDGLNLEQEFLVHTPAALKRIRVRYNGVQKLTIGADGSLQIKTDVGTLAETAPAFYTERDGARQSLQGHFELISSSEYTFAMDSHTVAGELVVDPTLLYSTFAGGSGADQANGVAADGSGNAYVAGSTQSADFPTTLGSLQSSCPTSLGCIAAFVVKLDDVGNAVYATYLGSSTGYAMGRGIAVNTAGEAYLTGTASSGFPTTPNAFQSGCSGSAFLAKIGPQGHSLEYSSCFGGDGDFLARSYGMGAYAVAVDVVGKAAITGFTDNGGYPTTANAFQKSLGGYTGIQPGDAFVTVVDPSLSGAASLLYSSYLGGSDGDAGQGITFDSYGRVYVAGYTRSLDFPITSGAFQTTNRGPFACQCGNNCPIRCSNGFLSKIDPSQSGTASLIYSTYLGGNGGAGFFADAISSVAVDGSGNAYVTGTGTQNFPTTPGAYQPTSLGGPFISKLNAAGTALIYSTYLQPSRGSAGTAAIALDEAGHAYVTGSTTSPLFPVTPDAFQSSFSGGYDAFLAELNDTGSSLLYSTYLGGNGDDEATGIAVDLARDVYVAGLTQSANFPTTPGAFQTWIGGGTCAYNTICSDAFLTKFTPGASQSLSILGVAPNTGGNIGNVTITVVGAGFQTGASGTLLCRSGSPVGQNPTVTQGGTRLTLSFDLTGLSVGVCTLTVMNPNTSAATLPNAFTVQAGLVANVLLNIAGSDEIRLGDTQPFFYGFTNTGNVDSAPNVFWLSLPADDDSFEIPMLSLSSSSSSSASMKARALPLSTSSGRQPSVVVGNSVLIPIVISVSAGHTGVLQVNRMRSQRSNSEMCVLEAKRPHWGCDELVSSVLDLYEQLPVVPPPLDCVTSSLGAFCHLLDGNVFGAALAYGKAVASCFDTVTTADTVIERVVDLMQVHPDLGPDSSAETCKDTSPSSSFDPNNKAGLKGSGPQQFVGSSTPLQYAIYFGNESTATAPAQVVTITDSLSASVDDLTSFSFGPVSFGNQTITPSPGASFSTTVDLRPNTNLLVGINANVNPNTGVVTWKFASLDPTTGAPTTDPTAGFLPIGGNGSIFFTVMPKQTLSTGTQIQNQATVVFDVNAPINTPTWLNTLDFTPPTSHVLTLPATESSTSFVVQWQGSDVGAGVHDYTIYVSDNAGPFTAWQTNTTATSGTYTGVTGHTYGFYSIARDLVGNVEGAKTAVEATTAVQGTGPACATDVSSQVTVTRGGFRYNHATNSFVQTLTLQNIGPSLIGAALVLDSLTSGATLSKAGGSTQCDAPLGSPWVVIPGTFGTGQSASLTLNFSDPRMAGIQYSTRVLAGNGQP